VAGFPLKNFFNPSLEGMPSPPLAGTVVAALNVPPPPPNLSPAGAAEAGGGLAKMPAPPPELLLAPTVTDGGTPAPNGFVPPPGPPAPPALTGGLKRPVPADDGGLKRPVPTDDGGALVPGGPAGFMPEPKADAKAIVCVTAPPTETLYVNSHLAFGLAYQNENEHAQCVPGWNCACALDCNGVCTWGRHHSCNDGAVGDAAADVAWPLPGWCG
jgi:hypothetical protein